MLIYPVFACGGVTWVTSDGVLPLLHPIFLCNLAAYTPATFIRAHRRERLRSAKARNRGMHGRAGAARTMGQSRIALNPQT
jgi:hypothetical protein